MKNKNQMEGSLLTRKDIDKAAWSYIFFAQATQNFERMMGLAFCHVMEPVLKKLYGEGTEEYQKALERHMQFYNTEPQLGALIPGITIAMEEARAKGENVSEELIVNTKNALMGPFAGIGDSSEHCHGSVYSGRQSFRPCVVWCGVAGHYCGAPMVFVPQRI